MKRRAFLASMAGGAAAAPVRKEAPPNFVFIMADDLGVFDLGCYGQKVIQTPSIDRLAAEGTRFTDCYAGASVCAPSRSVLMTGQHTGHTTVRANMSLRTGGRVALKADDVTVAQVLQGVEWRHGYDESAGYATGIFGKWGLGEPGTTGLPNDHGFDEWFGFLNQQHAHWHYPEYLWRNGKKEILKGNLGGRKREDASDLFCREALHFIDRHRYEPFFLYFTPTVPHAAFDAPELGSYATLSVPEDAKNYAAMVSRMDSYVGRIMTRLQETGLDENTLVLFCSDNGGVFDPKPFGTMGPLRGKKGSNFEGGLRIPMIARWPRKVAAGAVSGFPWSFCDVLPTLADLAGVRGLPRNIDGMSIAPALLGKQQNGERPLYWESVEGGALEQAVRIGRWKAHRKGPGAPVELYDLAADIGEKDNVAASHVEVVRRIEAYLAECRTDSEEYPVGQGRRRR